MSGDLFGELPAPLASHPALRKAPRLPVQAPPIAVELTADLHAKALALVEDAPVVHEGEGSDAATYELYCRLRDLGLSEEQARPYALRYGARCGFDHEWVLVKLSNAYKYATGTPGPVDTVELAKTQIDSWVSSGSSRETIPAMLKPIADAARAQGWATAARSVVIDLLKAATGWGANRLGLPAAIDPERLKERRARRAAYEAGDATVIDTSDPLAIAKRFQAESFNGERLSALVRMNEEWFWHNGRFYEPRGEERVRADLYAWLERKRDLEGNPVKPDRALVENVVHALASVALATVSPRGWLSAPEPFDAAELLVCDNVIVHTLSRATLPHTRALWSRSSTAYGFDPAAPSPRRWLRFLDEVFGDDSKAREAVQEFFGLSLTRITKFQKGLMPIGPKRSGKGTMIRVLTALVGLLNVANPTLNSLGERFGLQNLVDKVLAIVTDARLSHRSDLAAVAETILKLIGEDSFSVQRKHLDDVTLRLFARFILVSNEPPALTDSSGALVSRFILVKLTRSFFGKEDTGLEGALMQELPGIVLWALDGLERLLARGHFVQPKSGLAAIEELGRLTSPVASFAEDTLEFDPKASIACRDLFEAWRAWCGAEGFDRPGSAPLFARNFGAAFPHVRTVQMRAASGARERRHVGVRLLSRDVTRESSIADQFENESFSEEGGS